MMLLSLLTILSSVSIFNVEGRTLSLPPRGVELLLSREIPQRFACSSDNNNYNYNIIRLAMKRMTRENVLHWWVKTFDSRVLIRNGSKGVKVKVKVVEQMISGQETLCSMRHSAILRAM